MTTQEKLDLLKYLIFLRGKLQHASIELLTMGEDTTKVDQAEQKLADQIDVMRGKVMDDWNGNAGNIMSELQDLNEKAQTKLRQMRTAVDKAQAVADFVGILDKGLSLVAGLVT